MRKLGLGILLLITAAFAGEDEGRKNAEPQKDSQTHFAEEIFAPYIKSGEFPGLISYFYDNGRIEKSCLGYADVAAKRPIGMDDLFQQCSQTKGFCGVTIAKLVEEGKLSLDDPVSKYLPEFKELWVQTSFTNGVKKIERAKNTLTVRMCLNHMGGFWFELPNYEQMGGWAHRMPLRSVAAVAAAIPLKFDPGTQVSYSNVGIDIGAAIVEVITGMRWENYLKKEVLDPLGMASSTFVPTDAQLATRIQIYEIKKSEKAVWVEYARPMAKPFNDDRTYPSAGAGLWTTANDQLKFYKMLMNLGIGDNGVRILKEDTVKNLLAVSTRPQGRDGYSLGLVAAAPTADSAWFGHGGAWQSECHVDWKNRRLRMLVVQYRGKGFGWVRKLNSEAADRFFKTKSDNSNLDQYTGRMQ